MRHKSTYYFTYKLRELGDLEARRGGFVFKSGTVHPERFTRTVLWPEVLKVEPGYLDVKYRSHEIHDWPYEDVTYQPLEVEDVESDR
ncbi:MAG: hypothetical protein JWP00_2270 [Chloroflexi bacterium]|nr:hypothetical protein [Chloroflexota bacterium]